MPVRLETIINGESLFNDGIGIVLFITFVGLAATPGTDISWTDTSAMLHVSIPLAVVAAGLLIGSSHLGRSRDNKLSSQLDQIWKLFDELLNTILFVLIGLQMILISFNSANFIAGGIAIVLLLLARLLSIVLPVIFLKHSLKIKYNSILILTWGGLRGGISVALALSLPASPYRELILTASFCIVIFSIVVQGLTLNKVVNKLV